MNSVVVLEEIPREEKLGREWDRLVLEMERPEIFYTYEWALAVSRAFASSMKPLLILVYEGVSLKGIASLAISLKEPKETFFLGDKTADYCDIVSSPAHRASICEVVLRELRKRHISKFMVFNLPCKSETRKIVGIAAEKSGYHSINGIKTLCPQVRFGTLDDRTAIKRTIIRKQSVQRHLSALSKVGHLEFCHVRNWNELQKELGSFFNLHIARFLGMRSVSPFLTDERRLFFFTLGELLSERGWLTVSKLNINGRPIAWNFGFEFSGKWFWYMPTFDIEYERYSPGEVLLKGVLEEAMDKRPVDVVDLGLGDEFYKKRLANACEQIDQITLTDSWFQYLRVLGRSFLVKVIKRSNFAEKSLRTLMKSIGSGHSSDGVGQVCSLVVRALRRMADLAWSRNRFCFFEWKIQERELNHSDSTSPESIQPLDWTLLTEVAMIYRDDPETVDYCGRAGVRLRKRKSQGFVLMTDGGTPVHLCWVDSFGDLFLEELQTTLESPQENSVILFDCWTPCRNRGKNYYSSALKLVAERYSKQKKNSWIFASLKNTPSLRGIAKAGFNPEFIATNSRILFWRFTRKAATRERNFITG